MSKGGGGGVSNSPYSSYIKSASLFNKIFIIYKI